MKFKILSSCPGVPDTSCICLGLFQDETANPSTVSFAGKALLIDKATQGNLNKALSFGDFNGALGSTQIFYGLGGLQNSRVLVFGLGKESEYKRATLLSAFKGAISALFKTRTPDATFIMPDLLPKGVELATLVQNLVTQVCYAHYRYSETKSKPEPEVSLQKLDIAVFDEQDLSQAVKQGECIAKGVELARSLGNLPANICTPTYLGEQVLALGKVYDKLTVKVLDETQIAELKMGSFLSVAQGSRQPPRLLVLEYKGTSDSQKPFALVGKGITFDSGGISLKPGAAMDEMKFDMCGGASVLGTFKAVCELDLPINLVGIVPATENMPGGKATKPGDIVTSMSGQTIEILNTDAEGRLVLCDGLTYSARYEPQAVIDIATLTGACIVALGHYPSGLFTEDDELAAELLTAGEQTWDRAWRMPLWDEYQDGLKSNFADMANISGGRDGGAIIAAAFLARFTKDMRWAHLDIAGTAWDSGSQKGATGRPVSLLTQWLINRV